MPRSFIPLALLFASVVNVSAARGQESPPRQGGADADIKALAEKIDGYIATQWERKKVKPAAQAEDAAFLRRVYLDVTGRIPPVTEVRDFLDDPSPDKRLRLVEKLLNSEEHAQHFATTWRRLLLPQAGANGLQGGGLEVWLQKRVRQNTGYDRVAREILTAAIGQQGDGLSSFYQANEYKPENLGAAASRVFLGVRLECAQCHDHPFAKYTREQFWSFAAFFARVTAPGQGGEGSSRKAELQIPGTKKVMQAQFLGAKTPAIEPKTDPRAVLADWVTSTDNPFFARASANRLWAHFFGIGLIDPTDEIGEEHEASHPELLDELARAFTASGFDLRFLIRAITASKTYQLSSLEPAGKPDPRLFARMPVRGLTAEQLYDSLAQATGKYATTRKGPQLAFQNGFGPRTEFVALFSGLEKSSEASTSILQALHLMNGKAMAEATSLQGNRFLKTLAEAKGRTTAERIEELYVMVLSRRPREEETARFAKYVDSGGPRGDARAALGDVLWVLLNSPDFYLNH